MTQHTRVEWCEPMCVPVRPPTSLLPGDYQWLLVTLQPRKRVAEWSLCTLAPWLPAGLRGSRWGGLRAQAPPCRLGSSSLRRPTGRGPCAQSSSQSCSPGAGWAWADPRPQALPFSCFLPEDPPGGGQATGAMVETINWKRQLIPKGKHFQIRYYSLGLKNGTLPRGKTVY